MHGQLCGHRQRQETERLALHSDRGRGGRSRSARARESRASQGVRGRHRRCDAAQRNQLHVLVRRRDSQRGRCPAAQLVHHQPAARGRVWERSSA